MIGIIQYGKLYEWRRGPELSGDCGKCAFNEDMHGCMAAPDCGQDGVFIEIETKEEPNDRT